MRFLAHPFVLALGFNAIPLFQALGDQDILNQAPNDPDPTVSTSSGRPFYAIAHQVQSVAGIQAAVTDGANAIEIDLTAWKDTWWAGNTAEEIFQAIGMLRTQGHTVNFVWLDLKNPDYCDADDVNWVHCSIHELRALTAKYLEPAGVRVLYGFDGSTVSGKAYQVIAQDIKDHEALSINGQTADVVQQFRDQGEPEQSRRVMSYGWPDLAVKFGSCDEDDFYTCAELRRASQTEYFGKVFGWTVTAGQDYHVAKLLDVAGVDGLVYGFDKAEYGDHPQTWAAMEMIRVRLERSASKRYLARQEDQPW